MAEWHVSGSESEGEGVKESAVSFRGFEGLRIPTSRIVELLRTVESRKTLELDNARRKERKRKKKHKKSKVQSPGAVRNPEEVSETASEVRSTNSTTDCRDARRPSLSRFDYSHEDFPALAGKPTVMSKRPPDHRKGKKLASFDSIAADVKRYKRQKMEELWRDKAVPEAETAQQPSHQTPLTSQHHTTVTSPDGGGPCGYLGNGPETGSPMEVDNTDSKLPQLSFDEDSDLELQTSEMDMKIPFLSQIDRVEKLLDAEGLT